jgi:hypothetical protein
MKFLPHPQIFEKAVYEDSFVPLLSPSPFMGIFRF